MSRRGPIRRTAVGACLLALTAGNAVAEPGFKGKTVTILVGTSPGGGYDAYARMLARFLPKHLPGSTVMVKNMTGGGGERPANHNSGAAPAEGTAFALSAHSA